MAAAPHVIHVTVKVTVDMVDLRNQIARILSALGDDASFAAAEADTCPGCQTPRSESEAPENEGRYVVSAIRCHACTAIERQRAMFARLESQGAGMGGAGLRG